MKLVIVPLLAVLAGCAAVSGVKDAAIDRLMNRVGEYCATTTPIQRMAYKSQIDKGNGAVIEVYCDRL